MKHNTPQAHCDERPYGLVPVVLQHEVCKAVRVIKTREREGYVTSSNSVQQKTPTPNPLQKVCLLLTANRHASVCQVVVRTAVEDRKPTHEDLKSPFLTLEA